MSMSGLIGKFSRGVMVTTSGEGSADPKITVLSTSGGAPATNEHTSWCCQRSILSLLIFVAQSGVYRKAGSSSRTMAPMSAITGVATKGAILRDQHRQRSLKVFVVQLKPKYCPERNQPFVLRSKTETERIEQGRASGSEAQLPMGAPMSTYVERNLHQVVNVEITFGTVQSLVDVRTLSGATGLHQTYWVTNEGFTNSTVARVVDVPS